MTNSSPSFFEQNLIGTTARTETEESFKYPSFTICFSLDKDFLGVGDANWIPESKYNFPFPFADMGAILDKHHRLCDPTI